ncbi:MAG TPA: alcohol dehydrogenase catalytic domain-containing protein [Candidatus Acidoferrum sp.]|nr:alcohol dehydrogenase catalytic domain-containing protein [Candidatus Acidoferrum sp.]
MTERMRAQVFYEPQVMQMEELPIPHLSEIDVLIRVRNCGICGSDLSYYSGVTPLGTATGKGPLILGHEFAGEVVEVGAVPKRLGVIKPGDRVVVNPVQNCNTCSYCAEGHPHMCPNMVVPGVSENGAFAEYCLSRYTGLFSLPEHVSDRQAAFVEALACVVHGFEKLDAKPGQSVAIFGPGSMGLLMVQLAKVVGAGRVVLIGTRDDRLEAGKRCGADNIFNVQDSTSPAYTADLKGAIADLTHGALVDRAILATSSPAAFAQALEVTGKLAIVVYFALPGRGDILQIPAFPSKVMEKEIRFSRVSPLAWPTALRLVSQGQIQTDTLLSWSVPLEQTVEAMRKVQERVHGAIKVQVTP